MATAIPLYDNPKEIELTVSGLQVTNDLRLYYLPDEAIDFVVDSDDVYLVQFDNSTVFGVPLAILKRGNNIFTPLNEEKTRVYAYTEDTLSKILPGNNVSTTPIVIPPKPHPKFVLRPM